MGLSKLLFGLQGRIPLAVVALIDVEWEHASRIECRSKRCEVMLRNEVEISVQVVNFSLHGTRNQSPNGKSSPTDTGEETCHGSSVSSPWLFGGARGSAIPGVGIVASCDEGNKLSLLEPKSEDAS